MSESRRVFNDKSQIKALFLDNIASAYNNLSNESKSPNRSQKISTEDFLKSADELAEPFSKAVEACYAV